MTKIRDLFSMSIDSLQDLVSKLDTALENNEITTGEHKRNVSEISAVILSKKAGFYMNENNEIVCKEWT